MDSTIRLPVTAVMFAATSGIVEPVGSGAARSTSKREEVAEDDGTRKASS